MNNNNKVMMNLLLAILCVTLSSANVLAMTTSVSLYVSQTKKLVVYKLKGKIKWKSSNKNIVSVSAKGKIKAKKPGRTYITATNGKKSVRFKVVVSKKKKYSSSPIPVVVETLKPVIEPTAEATMKPTEEPTIDPTMEPTEEPTPIPTLYPEAIKDPFAISDNYIIDEDDVTLINEYRSVLYDELWTNLLVENVENTRTTVRVFNDDGSSQIYYLKSVSMGPLFISRTKIHKVEDLKNERSGYFLDSSGMMPTIKKGLWIDVLVGNNYMTHMGNTIMQNTIYADWVYVHDFEYEKNHQMYYKNIIDYSYSWDGKDSNRYKSIINNYSRDQKEGVSQAVFNDEIFTDVSGNELRIFHPTYESDGFFEKYELASDVKVMKGGRLIREEPLVNGTQYSQMYYYFDGGEECSIDDINKEDVIDFICDKETEIVRYIRINE